MEVRVQLVHADGPARVVLVSAYAGERLLGSALGEATDAEAAEDRALGRLLARLAAAPPQGAAAGPAVAIIPVADHEASAAATAPLATPSLRSVAETTLEPSGKRNAKAAQPPQTAAAAPAAPIPAPITTQSSAEIQSAPPPVPIAAENHSPPPPATTDAPLAAAPSPEPPSATPAEPPADPEDWSSELLHLDRELKRLNWGRPEEEVYLQRAFGHPSRNRLTSYADLLAYLRAVEALSAPADPAAAAVPMRRQELLSQCDDLLRQLGWPTERARQFLETQLQVSSRQQLGDQDLLQFNLLLEGELLAAG
jgi:hypothetical protein